MKEKIVFTEIKDIRTLIDPYRMKILRTFTTENEQLTAKMVADILEEVPSKVSYHIKKMEKTGILEIVNTKVINGIVAKYYSPTAKEFRVETLEEDDFKYLELNNIYSDIINDFKKSFIRATNNIKNPTVVLGKQVFLNEEQFSELSKIINDKILEFQDSGEGKDSYQAFFTLYGENDLKNIIKTNMTKL
ncbi:helix-turn-helix domain-containing protein [Mycoplasmatota bacterium zrk1]